MSTADKALQKLMKVGGEGNVTFDELTTVLSRKGFVLDRTSGSHQFWRHKDGRGIPLPRHGNNIKAIYVKKVRLLLLEEK